MPSTCPSGLENGVAARYGVMCAVPLTCTVPSTRDVRAHSARTSQLAMRVRSSSPALTHQCLSATVCSAARSRGSAAPRSLAPFTCKITILTTIGFRAVAAAKSLRIEELDAQRASSLSMEAEGSFLASD